MDKYIIVSFNDEIRAGARFEESKWPLHVTLMRTIHSERSHRKLIETLVRTVERQKAFVLVGKSEELFGPDNDRPVIELNLTAEAAALNSMLKDAFLPLTDQSVPDPYPIYRPHVTRQGDKGIFVGSQVIIDSASIVLVKNNLRLVLATVRFDAT